MNYSEVYRDYGYKMILRQALAAVMSIADRLIAALFIGSSTLVVVNLVSPVLMLSAALGCMFMTGLGVEVNYLLGKKDNAKANQTASFIILFNMILSIITCALMILFKDQVMTLIAIPLHLWELANVYYIAIALSIPGLIVGYTVDAVILADGNTKYSMFANMVQTAGNVTLNILFVAVFKMGIVGLGLATVISATTYMILTLGYFVFKRSRTVKLVKPAVDLKALFKISYNGTSEFFAVGAEGIMMFVINTTIATQLTYAHLEAYSTVAIFVVFILYIYYGSIFGVSPVISKLLGERNEKDIVGLKNYSLKRSLGIGIVVYLMIIPLIRPVAGLFIEDSATLAITFRLYITLGFAYLFSLIPVSYGLYFTALKRPLHSVVISVVRTVVLIPGFFVLLTTLFGEIGIPLGFLVADAIYTPVCLWLEKKTPVLLDDVDDNNDNSIDNYNEEEKEVAITQ